MATSLSRALIIRFEGNTQDVEQKAEALDGKMKAAGAAAGAAGGLALAAGLAEAMNADAANAKLSAQLGATGQMAKDLGKVAGNLYSNAYGESLEQVNEAIRGVIQSGLVMEDASNAQLESITAKVLDLSTAFDQDLGGATEAVGQLMKTGLAPNAEAALDVVTRGFQEGADRSGDFLDTLTEYSVQFDKFGLDAGTATGILVQGMQAGARNSDLVADAIKEFSIRAVDGSKLTTQGFEAIGLSAGDMAAKIGRGGPESAAALDTVLDRLRAMPDPVARSQAAVALFGTQAEDLGDALFALDPSQAVQRLGDVGGAAERMGTALNDTAATDMEMFKRQAMGVAADFGAALLPAFREAAPTLENLGKALGAVTTFLADNWNWIKYVVAIIAGPLGFIAALKMAYDESTIFRNIVNEAFNVVRTVVEATWNVLRPIFDFMISYYRFMWEAAQTLASIAQTAWNAIVTTVNAVWTALQATFNAINTAYQFMGDKVMWLWNTIVVPAWDAIKIAINNAWLAIQTTFEALKLAVQFVGDKFMWLWNDIVTPAWNGMSNTITAVWNNGISPAFELLKTGVENVGTVFSTVVDGVKRVWNTMTGIMAKPINFFIETIWNDGIVRKAWNKLTGWIPGLGEKVKLGPLEKVPEGFALGGQVPGFGNKDTVPAMLTPGEIVVRKQIAEPYKNFLLALNSGQAEALQAAGRRHSPPIQRFAAGGMVGGEHVARAMNRKPYIWGGSSIAGTDCSGFMAMIYRGIMGEANPFRRIWTTASFPSNGFRPGLHSAFTIGNVPGSHQRGTLNGINVESGGSHGYVAHGGPAKGTPYGSNFHLPQVGGQFVSGGGGGGGGGGFFDFVGKILDEINPVRALIDPWFAQNMPGSGPYKDVFQRLPHIVLDELTELVKDKATAILGVGADLFTGAVGGIAGVMGDASVRQQVAMVAHRYRWGPPTRYWDAADKLIQGESGWNPNARNPSSSAAGLFQKMQSIHGPVEATPAGQAAWGFKYIRDRYGDPINAYSKWLSRSPHWYENGGWVSGQGPKLIMAHGGEYVLTSDEADAMANGRVSGTVHKHYHLTIQNANNEPIDLEARFRHMELMAG